MGCDSGIESGSSPASSRANGSARSPRIRSGRLAISRRHWRRSRITQREMSHRRDMQSTSRATRAAMRTNHPTAGSKPRSSQSPRRNPARDFSGIPLGMGHPLTAAHAAADTLMSGPTSPPRRSTARTASTPSRGAAPDRGRSPRPRDAPGHSRRRSPARAHPETLSGFASRWSRRLEEALLHDYQIAVQRRIPIPPTTYAQKQHMLAATTYPALPGRGSAWRSSASSVVLQRPRALHSL